MLKTKRIQYSIFFAYRHQNCLCGSPSTMARQRGRALLLEEAAELNSPCLLHPCGGTQSIYKSQHFFCSESQSDEDREF